MARRVFYSFHYDEDNWRVSQIRNIGAIEENSPASDNDWEAVKRGGDEAIKRWISGQLAGRSCTVVLIGKDTASRKWVEYEIQESWNKGMGVVGIYIHYLKDRWGNQSWKGLNPFENLTMKSRNLKLSQIVRAYDPPFWESTEVYACIRMNLSDWIEEAVRIRESYN